METIIRLANMAECDRGICLKIIMPCIHIWFLRKNCGKEMRDGYLFCSKDGAFSFANEVPGVFENAKNADGFVKITELKPSHRTHIKAAICEACRKVVLDY